MLRQNKGILNQIKTCKKCRNCETGALYRHLLGEVTNGPPRASSPLAELCSRPVPHLLSTRLNSGHSLTQSISPSSVATSAMSPSAPTRRSILPQTMAAMSSMVSPLTQLARRS
ncbi:hypothetical protein BDA96_09G087200 [Sorghum bicolor]|uniref:Uncharacterized protein n=2 Tax=Sorghum bicolor TaxID=4558 RepID=A0A1B6P786_SORBI|nr:hypothetical protein BDA96_09G087200 [Sorghum bicolor]KXG21580.1 hypothetical protein SORBI_3009G082500 [Sorghum bicolor]